MLFAGDVYMNLTGLGDPVGFENLNDGRASQRRLASLSFDAAGFGHGAPIAHDASRRFRNKWGKESSARETPTREAAWVTPCAKPRSVGSIQPERDRVAMGKAPASPIPKKKRKIPIAAAFHANAVSEVKIDHQTTTTDSARRPPIRSPSHPPGIWNRAYPHRKEAKIHPMVIMEKPISLWITGTAEARFTRSM